MVGEYRLSTPWGTYYNEIKALFEGDPDVRVEYRAGDGEDPRIDVYVTGIDKSNAIAELLPDARVFGNVTVLVRVLPTNEREETRLDLFRKAFEGNPALSYVATVGEEVGMPMQYVVFRNKVVQFFNDDLGDVNGNRSTLYEDIARDVFSVEDGIFFCTDTPDNVGRPQKG